jgi:hypothetical protein
MSTPILLPPLPEPDFALDQGDEPCYYAHTLRARDLEVARLVLEGAAKVAELSHPDDWAFIGATIRNLEVKHYE